MKTSVSVTRLVVIGLAVLALGALGGWYFFLRGSENNISAADEARGYESTAPTFEGSTGSSNADVVSTLGNLGSGAGSSTSRLWQVSEVPVAGFGWVASSAGAAPTIYFVERSSGNVLEAQTSGRVILRLTDTLRPKTYEALVSNDGSIVERSVDDTGAIITFAGSVASSTLSTNPTGSGQADTGATSSVGSLEGTLLPQGIASIAADAKADTLFYVIPSSSGVSVVSTNWSGAKETSLFSSSIEDWRLIAPGDGSLVLLQSPLDGEVGYAYKLQKGGGLALLAEGPGLTILPRANSAALLFGSSANGTLSLFSQSSAGATPVALSIKTVADKCAWSPAGLVAYCGVPQTVPSQTFLDDWYKGIAHTSDEFYEVDASSASTTLVYDPIGDTSEQLDVEDPSVDPTGQYLAFINAADQSLWVLRIAQ